MLSREEVKNIAHLARIGLEASEEEKCQQDLSAVLDFFGELQKADTSDTEAIGHITGRTAEAREDVSRNISEEERRILLKNVPETKDNYIKVRSVF